MLPLSVSTELTMHALMKQASQCFTSGRYKQSYELYIEALLSAIKEFKRLEFINQCKLHSLVLMIILKLPVRCKEQ
ncbi:hypothetical protein EDC96DRAFT_516920 [Choanephora cucurbitarum]|nr:hypothetical protein EDC96DRAFT_516920 [Choanephora cucurbitarum]